MAFAATITYRAAYTAQALATLGAGPEWDRALSNYLRLEALSCAEDSFGPTRAAQDAITLERERLISRSGEEYRKTAASVLKAVEIDERQKLVDDAFAKVYADPHWHAAMALAKTPAPTLQAALFKVALIYAEDLGDCDGEPMDVVLADMERVKEAA